MSKKELKSWNETYQNVDYILWIYKSFSLMQIALLLSRWETTSNNLIIF